MKVVASLLSAALLASGVSAVRSRASRRNDLFKGRSTRSNGLPIYNTSPLNRTGHSFGPAGSAVSETDGNWGGALQISTGITQASGKVTFPSVNVPPGGDSSTEYLGCAWVGIDGDTCPSAILQAGIYWILDNGQSELFAFYEWYPAPVQQISISAAPGDVFSVTVQATSTTSGTVLVENETTGETFSQTLTGQAELCLENAEWILEDNEELPFAQFSTVTFSDISWTANGNTAGVSGATLLNIEQNNQLRTSCEIGSGTVQCSYLS